LTFFLWAVRGGRCFTSTVAPAEPATRFDRACRLGLPPELLDRAATASVRAASARRYLSRLVTELIDPLDTPGYLQVALVEARYSRLSSPLRCGDDFPACGGGEPSLAEDETAQRVAQVLRGPATDPATFTGGGRATGRALSGEGHIVLQDYVEHVAAYAVGIHALCSFVRTCFPAHE
jgi:hypothetical protein